MPLFRALAKNMAASYFGKKAAPYGFVMEVTLLYVFICANGFTRVRVESMATLSIITSHMLFGPGASLSLVNYAR
jgi:hypothetical protein